MLAKYHEAFSLPDDPINMFVQGIFSQIGAAGVATIFAHWAAWSEGVRNAGNFACKIGTFVATLPPLLYQLTKITDIGLTRLEMVFPENQYLSPRPLVLVSSLCLGVKVGCVLAGRIRKLAESGNEEDKNKLVALHIAMNSITLYGLTTIFQTVPTWNFWKVFMK